MNQPVSSRNSSIAPTNTAQGITHTIKNPTKTGPLFEGLYAQTPTMQHIVSQIQMAANATDTPVIILGEAGTGKEATARAIHQQSTRNQGPLLMASSPTLSKDAARIIVGNATGFPGIIEGADEGTLFFNEISELPEEGQIALLGYFQEQRVYSVQKPSGKKVSVRLIFSSQRDLAPLCQRGQFRFDLFYRIDVLRIELPPLRERVGDIPPLVETLVERFCHKLGREPMKVAPSAMRAIKQYQWPGNVRELDNALQRAVIMTGTNQINTEHLGLVHRMDIFPDPSSQSPTTKTNNIIRTVSRQEPQEDLSLEEYFQHFILANQNNMTETDIANQLGISRKCLWERRQRLGLPRRTKRFGGRLNNKKNGEKATAKQEKS